MKTFLLLCSLIAGSSIGEILSAKGMQQVGDISFRPKELVRALRQMARNPYLFGAITCLAISFFSFIGLLSYSDLSFIVPLTAVCYITKTIGAHFFLKERISRERWLGTLSVAFGVALISFDKRVEEALRTKALALPHQCYLLLIPDESMVSSQSPAAFWGIFAVRVALLVCVIAAIVYFLIAFVTRFRVLPSGQLTATNSSQTIHTTIHHVERFKFNDTMLYVRKEDVK